MCQQMTGMTEKVNDAVIDNPIELWFWTKLIMRSLIHKVFRFSQLHVLFNL